MRQDYKSAKPVLCPPSVAIVGASERGRWPKVIFDNLRTGGYTGKIFPINPRASTIWGVPCFPDFSALPETPSHALVIVPAPAVMSVLEQGVATGLQSATIYASSIGEGADPEIVARGEALRALIARSGLTVSGPNCMGGNALRERFFSYPNSELLQLPLGSVAVVSQSGGTLQHICQTAADRGVKFSYAVSSGNEIDLDLADFLDYLVDDENTKVIALFIEGIRRPEMFMRAAARALAAGKPIIALKTGKSKKSREAAQSHTGAISGDYDVFRAMCERYGIVHCTSLDDLVELMLVFQGGRLPKGKRVGWVTTSGGTVDILYDYLEDSRGIASPDFSAETKQKIRHLVPADIGLKNPLDAGIPSTAENATEMCIAVAKDPNIDMLAWLGSLPTGRRKPDPTALKSILAATDKPVIAFSRTAYIPGPDALAFQDDVGFPFLQSLPETVRALEALAFYGERVGRQLAPPPEPKGKAETLEGPAL
jgi:acyl-CoA synthetase (NDP forming)